MRKVYDGPSLPKIIYSILSENNTYEKLYTEKGINSIFNLFDDGYTISGLLDNSYICAKDFVNSKEYPDIWKSSTDVLAEELLKRISDDGESKCEE